LGGAIGYSTVRKSSSLKIPPGQKDKRLAIYYVIFSFEVHCENERQRRSSWRELERNTEPKKGYTTRSHKSWKEFAGERCAEKVVRDSFRKPRFRAPPTAASHCSFCRETLESEREFERECVCH
jgi:hypothetical protein